MRNDFTKPLVIRNESLGFGDLGIFVILCIWSYAVILTVTTRNISNFPLLFIFSLIVIMVLLYVLYGGLKKSLDRSPKIIIDRRGIEICKENLFFGWSEIETADIIRKSSRFERIYLKINDHSVDLFGLRYRRKKVRDTINSFSGREISACLLDCDGVLMEDPSLFEWRKEVDFWRKEFSGKNTDKKHSI